MAAPISAEVTIPEKLTFFEPEVSRNNSNCASPASSVTITSSIRFAVSLLSAAVYRSSTLPVAEINPPTYALEVSPWSVHSKISLFTVSDQFLVLTTASVEPEPFLELTYPSSPR